jgi:hypothetical protein
MPSACERIAQAWFDLFLPVAFFVRENHRLAAYQTWSSEEGRLEVFQLQFRSFFHKPLVEHAWLIDERVQGF